MVINKLIIGGALLLLAGLGHAREAASPAACQSAGQQPPLLAAKAAVADKPDDIVASFALADAWSEAGCFNDAVQVLQTAQTQNPGNPQLQTRLRVARSLVGEEHFFDNIDRAEAAARLKRDLFRCTSLFDLEACAEAARLAPNDPAVLSAEADGLLHANRAAEAAPLYRRAIALAPAQHDLSAKLAAAEAQLPSRSAPTEVADAGAEAPAAAAKPMRASLKVRLASAQPVEGSVRRYSNQAPDDAQSH
jgi:predicted Zn-dependent protease